MRVHFSPSKTNALVVRRAVLLDEAAERVQPIAGGGHAHVVGAARQLRQLVPAIGGRVVGVVIGLVDALLGIAADQVHAVAFVGDGPGHLGARDRQRRARGPAACCAAFGGGAVGDGLLGVQCREVDAAGLVEAFELAGVVLVLLLRSNESGSGQETGNKLSSFDFEHQENLAGAVPACEKVDLSIPKKEHRLCQRRSMGALYGFRLSTFQL